MLASHERATSFLETPAVLFDDTLSTKSLEGQCIGSYQLAARIGTGGMGEVYRARDTKLNRHVAIKVLLPASPTIPIASRGSAGKRSSLRRSIIRTSRRSMASRMPAACTRW